MPKFSLSILFLLCSYGAIASVVRSAVQSHESHSSLSPALRASLLAPESKRVALPEVQVAAHDEKRPIGKEETSCTYVLLGMLCLCAFGGIAQKLVGDQIGSLINLILWICLFTHLYQSGVYTAWWHGEHVSSTCQVVCWMVLLLLSLWTCMLCCVCCCFGIVYTVSTVIKNEMIKKMKEDYDERKLKLSRPRQAYYESDVFKQKCDDIFDKADKDKNGTLDMSELQGIVEEMLGKENVAITPLLSEAFDENHNSQVEKPEFAEMMKYVSVMQIQEGRCEVKQAFEVLCLPETATLADVNKANRRLAMEYHPDKAVRKGVSYESATQDMQEINDAKAVLEKHLQPQDTN